VYGLSPASKENNRWAIGRRKDCQVRVDDPSISGLHAHLVYTDKRWRLTDANSTHGIRYKGLLKSEVVLDDGDSIHLGLVEMVLRVFG
jgi:pSer/pThr/pTyr-binding forkhead associated (FHA) protein